MSKKSKNVLNQKQNRKQNSQTNNNSKKAIIGIAASIGALVLIVIIVLVVINFTGSKKLTCEKTTNLDNGEIKFIKEINYKKSGTSTETDTIIITSSENIVDESFAELKANAPFLFRVYYELELDEDDFEITRKDKEMTISANTKKSFNGKSFKEIKEKEEKAKYTCK